MGKFKVGDRVICTETCAGQFTAGKTYTVRALNTYSLGVVEDDFGSENGWSYDFFKPVPVAEATGTDAQADKPKFKVGDRVRVHDHPYYLHEEETTGTIVGASDGRGDWDVELDNYGGGSLSFLESELSLKHTTITIQPGRHYLTRDGRKVGPMRRWSDEAKHRWEADADGLPYIWADDGTEIDSDIDDSADLVAEASSSDNGSTDYGSTAGFTVPVCAYEDEPGWYAAELGRAYADGYAAGLRAAA